MSTDTRTAPDTSHKEVLDRVDEAVFALDDDWQFTFINDRMAEIIDADPAEILGSELWHSFPGIRDTAADEELQAAVDEQEAKRFDMHFEPADAWFSVRAYPSADGLTVCFYDVTETRGRQLELQRERRLFEAVFEDTNDALVIADTDRRITDFNPAAQRLFGYDPEEVVGEKARILYADETDYEQQGETRFNEEVPEQHDSYRVTYERADGTTFEGETVGTPLKGRDGETLAYLGAIRNVSDQVAYERAIEERNDVLRQFHDVTTDETGTFDAVVSDVLELAADHLDLDVGVLTRTDGPDCHVEAALAPGDEFEVGESFALDLTFEEQILEGEGAFGYHTPEAGGVKGNPAYETLGLESYVGAQVVVDGHRYGTLHFTSRTTRDRPISESEKTFVRILAQWVGKEISRRQSRKRARASSDRLRQIIDTLPQLVFAKAEDGTFLLANEALANAYGTTVDALEGATDADFADSEAEVEQFREDDRAVIESGEPKHIPEEPLTTADGEERTLETTKIPYKPVETEGDAVLGVATDITDRKRREAELEMQSAAMEAAMDGIAILDDDEYVYMNQAHADVFDFEAEELLGSPWRRLYGEEETERLEAEVFPELAETGEWRGETVGRKRDGTPVHQEITLSLLDDGKLICTNRDVTERKRREQELERQRTRLRALFDESPDGIVIHDATGTVLDVNDRELESLGYDREALLSMNVAEFEVGIDQQELESVWNDMDEGDVLKIEGTHQHRDGSTFPVEVWVNKVEVNGRERFIALSRDITERKQREEELETKTNQLEAILENTTAPMFMKDADGEYLLANREYREVFDLKDGDVVGKTDGELHPAEMAELVRENDAAVLDSGESIEAEEHIQTGDGERIYLTNKSPIYGLDEATPADTPDAVFGVANDITERTERERELERTKEFIEKAQESASIGGWEVDLEDASLRWTDEVYRIHGLPLDADVTVEDGIDFYHPADRDKITAAFENLRIEGESYDLELRIVTAEDDVRWVRTIGDPLLGEDGSVVGARGVFQDVTERKRNEQDLRELTERLDLAIEGANLGVWDWDMETDAVTFNEQWAEMLGLSLDDLEPTLETWEERVHPEDMPHVEQQLQAHLDGEAELYDCEHRMRTASGDWKWIRDVGEVVDRDDDGTPLRAVGIHLDITEQKQSQKYLEDERDMFAQGPAVVFKWQNEDGWPVEYVSENVTDTLGFTPEELQSGGVPYERLVHDDDLDRVAAEVEKHSDETTERFSHDPYRMVTASGDVKWITDNTKIIRENGEITHYLGYLIDITDRKNLEEELRESEQSLRGMTEIAADPDRSLDEKLEAILDLGCDRLGLPYGFLNKIGNETQHTIKATGEHPLIEDSATAPLSETYCRKTVDGNGLLGVANAVEEGWSDDPAYEAFGLGCYLGGKVFVDGDLYGTLCFAGDDARDHDFDDSERAFVELLVQWVSYELDSQAVERKLRGLNESARRLLATETQNDIATVVLDTANRVLDMPVTGIWRYDERTDTLEPVTMTDEAAALIETQPSFSTGEGLVWGAYDSGDVAVYDDLGDVDGLLNDDTPLRSEAIIPVGEYGVILAGAVDQRAFSDTDVNLLEVLSATVEAAWARSEREQLLRETRERLAESNEQLEQFAYAASHDLQEPLRTVASYLTLLERRYGSDLDEDAVEFIDIAVDAVERMRAMIQGLLAYSRVDTRGRSFEAVDLDSVFERVEQNLEVTIDEADAEVRLPTDAGRVKGDSQQLVQLFQNLLDNAIKYSEDRPTVDVSVSRAGDSLTVAVQDDGIGMDENQLDEIFEVFQRLHTREEFDGTGIGLSLCRKIVDRHDGDIRVESTPGEGSTFYVTLPVPEDNS